MLKEKIFEVLNSMNSAKSTIDIAIFALNDLVGDLDASDAFAHHRREQFQIIPGGKEKPAAYATESDDGILKFTPKEIQSMPKNYSKLFRTGLAIAHIRKQHNGSFEIRCQIQNEKISATAKTLTEAKKKFIQKLLNPKEKKASKIPLFGDYAEKWLEVIKKPTIKEPTYNDYLSVFNCHIYPAFGNKPIDQIGQFEIQAYINKLTEQGKYRAAKKHFQILSAIFKYAEIDNLIDHSPMLKLRPPFYEQESSVPLSKQEELTFTQKCLESGTRSGKAFILMMYTGIRRAELESATITKDGKFLEVIIGKQRKGRKEKTRKIPLCPRLLRLLPNLNIDELKELYPNRLSRTFKEWLPNHHLHELRHTFITRAQECGISRELVSLWAGHKPDNTMTSNVYTHFSDEFQLQEILKFDY